jgi:hypothetical protein
VYEARPGEDLDGGYRVRSAGADGVTLLYTPLGVEQQLSFAPDAARDGAYARDLRGAPVRDVTSAPSASFPPGSALAPPSGAGK